MVENLETTGGYKSQTEKFRAILDNKARQVEEITFSRADKSEIDELKNSEENSEEKFRQRSRELWKDFAVHGILRYDWQEKKTKLLPLTDLDGKTCLGLLELAGFDVSQVTYVRPGEFVPGAINLDTGYKTGIKIEDQTAWLDHHGKESTEASICAAKQVYLALSSKGFLKKDKTLDDLTRFVSRIDRGKYPQMEELFEQSDRTIVGLQRFISFKNLDDYFKEGRSPEEILSDNDLKKYGLENGSKEQKKLIENSKEMLKELERDGFIIKTKFGEVVVDVEGKLPGGYLVARAAGYDGYVSYSPRRESFFISINKADLSEIEFSQGVNIRKNMWIKPPEQGISLGVSLRQIIEKLGGEVPKKGESREMIKAIDMRFKEFIVTPRLSRDEKKQTVKIITWDLGKLAIFPENFRYQPGKKYRVRIKGDSAPGQRKGFYILEVLEGRE